MSILENLKKAGRIASEHKKITLEVAILSGITYLALEGFATMKSPACSFEIYLMNVKGMTHKIPDIIKFSALYSFAYDGMKKTLEDSMEYREVSSEDVIDAHYEVILF